MKVSARHNIAEIVSLVILVLFGANVLGLLDDISTWFGGECAELKSAWCNSVLPAEKFLTRPGALTETIVGVMATVVAFLAFEMCQIEYKRRIDDFRFDLYRGMVCGTGFIALISVLLLINPDLGVVSQTDCLMMGAGLTGMGFMLTARLRKHHHLKTHPFDRDAPGAPPKPLPANPCCPRDSNACCPWAGTRDCCEWAARGVQAGFPIKP